MYNDLCRALDEAMMRRFGNFIYVPKPGSIDRKQIIEINTSSDDGVNPLSKNELTKLSELTDGMSASDIGKHTLNHYHKMYLLPKV